MRIEAITGNPGQLIAAITAAINDEVLQTWIIRTTAENEIRYTHSPEQWLDKATIAPAVAEGKAVFSVRWWNNNEPDEPVKGYYAGRFTEILLVHFRDQYNHLQTFA